MQLKSVSYEERRLNFVKDQLAHANRRLDYAIKHGTEYDCVDRGFEVQCLREVVKMLEAQHVDKR